MTKSNFFNITDTSSTIKKELTETVVLNKPQADILFERIQQNQDLLSDDECFMRMTSSDPKDIELLNFLIDDASYFINVKYLTIALICLIFDIKISNGFAAFLLGMTGIDCAAIKLDNMEKCVAYKIKVEKGIRVDQLNALTQCNFNAQNAKCGHYENDGTCRIWTENDVQSAIVSLISKKIIKKVGDTYKIIF